MSIIKNGSTFPLSIKSGSSVAKIYKTPSNGSDNYTLAYWVAGERKRRTFAELSEAKAEAERVTFRLSRGNLILAKLSSEDCACYLRAKQLSDLVKVPLELAAARFAEAIQALGTTPLKDAVEYYLKKHPKNLQFRSVNEVIIEMLEAKRQDGLSPKYLQHLGYDLDKFAKAFDCNIANVTGASIDAWLRSLGVAPRTRNNLRTAVQTLFNYAKQKQYLPKDHDEIDAVPLAKDTGGEIDIFTPNEMTEVLSLADESVIPFLTVGAFAGIRHAEIQRLDWRDIHFDDRIIEIRAANAKTASRRTLPILDNLRQWLLPLKEESGLVCRYQNMAHELHRTVKRINHARRAAWALKNNVSAEELERAERCGHKKFKDGKNQPTRVLPGAETAKVEGWEPFAWKHNALRHSFISYRIAEIKNVAQVALEAGNSPQIIHSNYKELVRPADAQRWFSIVPQVGASDANRSTLSA